MDRAEVKDTRRFIYSCSYEPCLLRHRLFLFFLLLFLLGLRLFRVTTTLKGRNTSGGGGEVLAIGVAFGIILKSMVIIATVTPIYALNLLVLVDIGLVEALESCLIVRLPVILPRSVFLVLALTGGVLRRRCSTYRGALAGVLLVPLILITVFVGLSVLILPIVL